MLCFKEDHMRGGVKGRPGVCGFNLNDPKPTSSPKQTLRAAWRPKLVSSANSLSRPLKERVSPILLSPQTSLSTAGLASYFTEKM